MLSHMGNKFENDMGILRDVFGQESVPILLIVRSLSFKMSTLVLQQIIEAQSPGTLMTHLIPRLT